MAGIGCVATGVVVGGLGGRIVMRIAGANAPPNVRGARTEAGFRVGEVTLGGTIELIIFIGIFVGIAGAAVYVMSEPWLTWTGKWRGLALGLLLLATASSTSDAIDPTNFDFRILDHAALNVTLFALLFLSFGALAVWVVEALEKRGREIDAAHPLRSVAGFMPLVALGAIAGTGLMTNFFLNEESCGCEPKPLIAAAILVMAIATVLLWASRYTARLHSWGSRINFLGYLALTSAFVVGGWHFVRDVADIV
jgi:hypothetical protein